MNEIMRHNRKIAKIAVQALRRALEKYFFKKRLEQYDKKRFIGIDS